ncbi:unnamed protein product [Rhizoctonia solani]|uniref:Uncharacterized protein n=1 Tax=Rhizoctonia solani TaxID=456999 RepID=A0A8H3HH92_9AGAM|nr:unnamed protein product [Rhizoctonia solani]
MSYGSATSSFNPSLAWSMGNGGKGRVNIKFPFEMGWYNEQPCTTFQALQHRKEPKGFKHEFIVLLMTNGYICRVERMGDPNARFDALSTQGSIAHDVAQVFPSYECKEAMLETSEIIVEFKFPCQLDLKLVLNICRALHEGEKTRNYTLRGFNCYFFALTLQSCLTRWIALDLWDAPALFKEWLHNLEEVMEQPQSQATYLSAMLSGHSESTLAQLLLSLSPSGEISENELNIIYSGPYYCLQYRDMVGQKLQRIIDDELWYTNLPGVPSYLIEQEVKQSLQEKLQHMANTSISESTEDGSTKKQLGEAILELVSSADARPRSRRADPYEKMGLFLVKQRFQPHEKHPTEIRVTSLPQMGYMRHEEAKIRPLRSLLDLTVAEFLLLCRFQLINSTLWILQTFLGLWGIYLYNSSPTPCVIVDEEVKALLEESATDPTKLDRLISDIRALCKDKSAVWIKLPWADICAAIERLLECKAPMTGYDPNIIDLSFQGREKPFRQCSTQEFQAHILSRIQHQAELVEFMKLGSAVEVETELKSRLSEVWRLIREEEDLEGGTDPETDRACLGSCSRGSGGTPVDPEPVQNTIIPFAQGVAWCPLPVSLTTSEPADQGRGTSDGGDAQAYIRNGAPELDAPSGERLQHRYSSAGHPEQQVRDLGRQPVARQPKHEEAGVHARKPQKDIQAHQVPVSRWKKLFNRNTKTEIPRKAAPAKVAEYSRIPDNDDVSSDPIPLEALAWIIKTSEDPKSTDTVLQAIAGADPNDAYRRLLKESRADKRILRRLIGLESYSRNYDMILDLYTRAQSFFQPSPTVTASRNDPSTSSKEKAISGSNGEVRKASTGPQKSLNRELQKKLRDLRDTIDKEIITYAISDPTFLPTIDNIQALRIGSTAACHCLQSLQNGPQALGQTQEQIDYAVELLESCRRREAPLSTGEIQYLMTGTAVLLSSLLVDCPPDMGAQYVMRLLRAINGAGSGQKTLPLEDLGLPMAVYALSRYDYPGWTQPPPLNSISRTERAIEMITHYVLHPKELSSVSVAMINLGLLELLSSPEECKLDDDDIGAIAEAFDSVADDNGQFRVHTLSTNSHAEIYSRPLKTITTMILNEHRGLLSRDAVATACLTVLHRTRMDDSIPLGQVYAFVTECVLNLSPLDLEAYGRNVALDLMQKFHDYPNWTQDLFLDLARSLGGRDIIAKLKAASEAEVTNDNQGFVFKLFATGQAWFLINLAIMSETADHDDWKCLKPFTGDESSSELVMRRLGEQRNALAERYRKMWEDDYTRRHNYFDALYDSLPPARG